MGEISFINGLVMAGLFTICLFAFAVNFAIDNDSEISLSSDNDFSTTNASLYSDLITFNSSVGSAGNSFNEDNVQEGTDTATSGGQFKNPASASYGTASSNLKSSFNKIFGPEFAIISITLINLIAFMAIRYAYKTWFGKDPD